jgi:hypothetical protein
MNEVNRINSEQINADPVDLIIVQSLAKLDGVALGISLGCLFGLAVFLSTNVLLIKGGDVIGPNLALLGHYFVGFEVTFAGSIVGMIYGFITGFVFGWLTAILRNTVIAVYIHILKLKRSMSAVNDYIDNP